jgi:hypothetical protein
MIEISYKAFYFMKWPDAGKFGKLEMIGLEQFVRLGIYFGSFLGSRLGVFVPLLPLHSMTNSRTVHTSKLGKK